MNLRNLEDLAAAPDARAVSWPVQACMGGWCTRREKCRHYAARDASEPAERLCLPGQDGVRDGWPVVVQRAAGTWERGSAELLAPASPFPVAA